MMCACLSRPIGLHISNPNRCFAEDAPCCGSVIYIYRWWVHCARLVCRRIYLPSEECASMCAQFVGEERVQPLLAPPPINACRPMMPLSIDLTVLSLSMWPVYIHMHRCRYQVVPPLCYSRVCTSQSLVVRPSLTRVLYKSLCCCPRSFFLSLLTPLLLLLSLSRPARVLLVLTLLGRHVLTLQHNDHSSSDTTAAAVWLVCPA